MIENSPCNVVVNDPDTHPRGRDSEPLTSLEFLRHKILHTFFAPMPSSELFAKLLVRENFVRAFSRFVFLSCDALSE